MADSDSQGPSELPDDRSDHEGSLVIEEPPMESPLSKGDNSETNDEEAAISKLLNNELRQQVGILYLDNR